MSVESVIKEPSAEEREPDAILIPEGSVLVENKTCTGLEGQPKSVHDARLEPFPITILTNSFGERVVTCRHAMKSILGNEQACYATGDAVRCQFSIDHRLNSNEPKKTGQ